MSEPFFSGDLHFFHKRIIELDELPYENVEEMNEAIIDNWNSKINTRDEAYILGDLGLGNFDEIMRCVGRLKGHLHFIPGNHDHAFMKKIVFMRCFESIELIKELRIAHTYKGGRLKTHVVLCHYPLLDWDKRHYGAIHLHAHTHNIMKDYDPKAINVGIAQNGMMPWSWPEIYAHARKRCETWGHLHGEKLIDTLMVNNKPKPKPEEIKEAEGSVV